MTYNVQQIKSWLEEHTPHIELLEYGGKVKSISTFRNKNTGKIFENSLNNIKADYKRGRNVGLTKREQYELKRRTWQEKYGVDHPKKHPEIQKKYEQTCLDRYNSTNYFNSTEWMSKAKTVYKNKLGVDNPAKSIDVLKKIQETNQEKYGAKTFAQSIAQEYEGQTATDILENTTLSRSTVYNLLNKGFLPDEFPYVGKVTTELPITKLLTELSIDYIKDKQLPGTKLRPDFFLPEHNMVIECDGLYWHSDRVLKDKNYHAQRRNMFVDVGTHPLFFREDEIQDKLLIIRSIISNAVGLSERIYARSTVFVGPLKDKQFLIDNHLMGNGQGRIYALKYKGQICSMMQVRGNSSLEISRFCHKLNTTVVGGFSKLLSNIIKIENPNKISTFIDLRYGRGSYLSNLGFEHVKTNVSFKWTNNNLQTFHRMRYPGNSGYDHNLYKIWDCGQAKWELSL